MHVVIDTNVLFSGIFWRGLPGDIIDAWMESKFHLICTAEILAEYFRVASVLSEKYHSDECESILNYLVRYCRTVTPISLVEQICEDPDDDKFIACALTSKEKIIITGDKLLLKVNGYEGLHVLKPKQFVVNYL